MCQVSQCCCCVPLRIGCIVLAILSIIGSFSNMIVSIVQKPGTNDDAMVIAFAVINGVFGIVVWCILLGGAMVNSTTTVGVAVVLLMIQLILGTVLNIIKVALLATAASKLGVWNTFTITLVVSTGVGTLIGLGLGIYFWIVIYSFYRELKAGGPSYPY